MSHGAESIEFCNLNNNRLSLLTATLLLLLTLSSRSDNLFVDTPVPLSAKTPAFATRQRYVKVNPTMIDKLGIAGSTFDVTLFDGEQLTFRVDKANLNPAQPNSLILQCSVPGQPWNNLILSRVNNSISASVHTGDGRVFQIGAANGATHYIRQLDPNLSITCGVQGKTQPTPFYHTQTTATANAFSCETVPSTLLTPRVAAPRPILDVMVVYTADARDEAGSDDAINAEIATAITEGQSALDASQITMQLRLVYTGLINYTESGDFNTDLVRLGNPNDGFLDDAITIRDKYKADIISLWVKSSTGLAGLAYQLIPNATLYTYNVIWRRFAVGLYVPMHEIGHNFGCDHEITAPHQPNPIYPFAHALEFQSPDNSLHDTVMTAIAIPGRRIPYFSSPNLFYDNGSGTVATGTTNANNAQIIANTMSRLTSFRTPPGVGEGLDLLTVNWSTGGDATWFWEPGISHDNSDAAESGGITNNQSSWLQGTLKGPARFTFWYKTSGQSSIDALTFDNGAGSANVWSGTNDWTQADAFIPAGAHVVTWTYTKQSDTGIDQGHAWVDQVKVQLLHVPTVAITSPAAGARVFTPPVTVQGTAKDDIHVSEVDYMLQNAAGNTGWLTATGTTNWSANLNLVAGTNTITVRSVGYGGQTSALVSRSFFYVVTNMLTVTTNGLGKITPNMNGKFLEIGRRYSITAIPSNNWVFSNWSGSISSNAAVLNFLMQSNMVLNGNFVTNPFIPVAGVYNGLFSEAGVRQTSAGFITFTLTTGGTYAGRMNLDGGIYKFSGRFDLNGVSEITIARLRTNSVTLALNINLAAPDDTVSGTVSNADWLARFNGDRAVFNAVKNKAVGFAGKYTLAIQDPALAPAGDCVATVTVDNGGIIHAVGTMSDGTPFSQAVSISKNGAWPLYVPLYLLKGMVFCPVTFNGSPASTLSGTTTWIKPTMKALYYSNGFAVNTPLFGSAFVTPSNGVRVLNITNGTATLSAANLPQSISNTVTLNTNNTFTVTGTNGMVLLVNKLTGAMTGSHFTDPVTHKIVPINAVLLQIQNEATGWFLGTNLSGHFQFQ